MQAKFEVATMKYLHLSRGDELECVTLPREFQRSAVE